MQYLCERYCIKLTWDRIVVSWDSVTPTFCRSQNRFRRSRSIPRRRGRRKDLSREAPWRSHAANKDTWPHPPSRWSRSLYSRSAIIIATVKNYARNLPLPFISSIMSRLMTVIWSYWHRPMWGQPRRREEKKKNNTELVITDGDVRIRSDEFLTKTYLSPGAPRTEGVSAAGEEALAVAEEHLDVITTILDALALILTGVDLVLRRGPRGVLQVRKRRQRQAVQIISEKTHFIYISVIACSPRVVKRVPSAKPDAINPLKVHWRRRDVAVLSPLVASVTFLVATSVKLSWILVNQPSLRSNEINQFLPRIGNAGSRNKSRSFNGPP